tara:strand:- start:4045 stop:4164 length:120 start_codon:yes stop_codon:yes gene_type:complete
MVLSARGKEAERIFALGAAADRKKIGASARNISGNPQAP